MKSFKGVEATRRDYHTDAALNSVHRSSLMVPELPGAVAEISFVNHFLLKRGYDNVGCRVTALDETGARIESRLHRIAEPRVYTIPLSGMVAAEANTYLVEFFTAENLFIPFPAVMVNHRGPGFLNTVHAYNRVLNDVFEDDAINARQVAETSVDVHIDDETDTFLAFTAGPQQCQGEIEIELLTKRATHRAKVPVDQPRLTTRLISLGDVLPDAAANGTGVLRVRQPSQFMFYGRLFAGQRKRGGAFSANHSYYDSSTVREYWDDARPSWRIYPLFPELENAIRMYPVMSEGSLTASLEFFGADGAALGSHPAGELTSPGASFLDIDVRAAIGKAGLDETAIAGYAFTVTPTTGETPTRVNHQIVHHAGGLASSVNMSLNNPNVFMPKGKTGFAWGQIPAGGGVESWFGLTADRPDDAEFNVEVSFYGAEGEVAVRRWTLPGNGALCRKIDEELAAEIDAPGGDRPDYLWYLARAARPDLSAYTVTRHIASGHCSGEHNF